MNKIRVFLQQRVIPTYRIPFMENLAKHPLIDLTVFSGLPMPHEMIKTGNFISQANFISTKNIHILRGSAYFCFQTQLTNNLNKYKPQVIILEGNARYLSTRLAFKWAHQHQSKLIGWGLGVPQKGSSIPAKINHYYWKKFLKPFDAMIAYSQTGAQQYQHIGFLPEQVFIAANATTHRPKDPPPQKKHDFQNNHPILLYVGRLQPRKRLDSLVRVCAQMQNFKPDLWIVGDGPNRMELETLANIIYPQTKFLGELYGAQLTEVFHKADLFVLPGTGGLAAQQAMAHALPVVMAAGDGTQTNLVNLNTGWSIPADDETALLLTLENALSDPQQLRNKGISAFNLVKNEVNIETMTEEFISAILYALNQKDYL